MSSTSEPYCNNFSNSSIQQPLLNRAEINRTEIDLDPNLEHFNQYIKGCYSLNTNAELCWKIYRFTQIGQICLKINGKTEKSWILDKQKPAVYTDFCFAKNLHLTTYIKIIWEQKRLTLYGQSYCEKSCKSDPQYYDTTLTHW